MDVNEMVAAHLRDYLMQMLLGRFSLAIGHQ